MFAHKNFKVKTNDQRLNCCLNGIQFTKENLLKKETFLVNQWKIILFMNLFWCQHARSHSVYVNLLNDNLLKRCLRRNFLSNHKNFNVIYCSKIYLLRSKNRWYTAFYFVYCDLCIMRHNYILTCNFYVFANRTI